MIALGPPLIVFGIGFFCSLLFSFAVYALPCFAGITAGFAAFHSGAGGIAVGFFAGAATFGGYHTTLGLTQFGVPSDGWRQSFAIVGAALVGATAWARMFEPSPFAAGDDAVTSRGHFR